MEKGRLQVYTGDGKGKTTAALGLCVRALGRDLRVCVIQFLKQGGCGEHAALQRLGLTVDWGDANPTPPWTKGAEPSWRGHTRKQLTTAQKAAKQGFDLLVMDELLGALSREFVSKDDVCQLIESRMPQTELVITGRNAPDWLIEKADLVTEMREIKHYMHQGHDARAGIEF